MPASASRLDLRSITGSPDYVSSVIEEYANQIDVQAITRHPTEAGVIVAHVRLLPEEPTVGISRGRAQLPARKRYRKARRGVAGYVLGLLSFAVTGALALGAYVAWLVYRWLTEHADTILGSLGGLVAVLVVLAAVAGVGGTCTTVIRITHHH